MVLALVRTPGAEALCRMDEMMPTEQASNRFSLCSMHIIPSIELLLLLFFLLMDGRFQCGALSCERSFNSSGALNRHRQSCLHYHQDSAAIHTQSRLKRRLFDATANQISKRAKQCSKLSHLRLDFNDTMVPLMSP